MEDGSPGSSVHGISQARILEWVIISFSSGSSRPRDQTRLLLWQVDSLPLSNQGIPIRAENTLNVGDHVKSLKPSNIVDGSMKQYNYFENSLAVS